MEPRLNVVSKYQWWLIDSALVSVGEAAVIQSSWYMSCI